MTKWSDHEVEQLRQLFLDGVPDSVIGQLLNRTTAAVLIKRKKERIIGDPNARRMSEEGRRKMSETRKRIPKEKQPSWKGGRRINSAGYVEIHMPEHHRARKNGYVFEHIVVAERKYGRKIVQGEHVHHKDHTKTNNDPENLEVITAEEHAKKHRKKKEGSYLNCVICGTVFYRKKSDLKRAKCCSASCVGKYTYLKTGGIKRAK